MKAEKNLMDKQLLESEKRSEQVNLQADSILRQNVISQDMSRQISNTMTESMKKVRGWFDDYMRKATDDKN